MRKTLAERFNEKTIPIPESGCIFWVGAYVSGGYGSIGVNGKVVSAHRVAWELAYGPISDGVCVLHKCDIPACVNPKHLFLGSQNENISDRNNKGRTARTTGQRNGFSKLSDNEVAAIRSDNRTLKEIAKEYSVHFTTVSLIKTRKTWRHVA